MKLQIYPSGTSIVISDTKIEQIRIRKEYPVDIVPLQDQSRRSHLLGDAFHRWLITLADLTAAERSTLFTIWDSVNGPGGRIAYTDENGDPYDVRWVNRFAIRSESGKYERYGGIIELQEYTP